MSKMPLSHKIDRTFFDLFETLAEQLGPPKYRILEAAIELFAALDTPEQLLLKSNQLEKRQEFFKLIRQVPGPTDNRPDPDRAVKNVTSAVKQQLRRKGTRRTGA